MAAPAHLTTRNTALFSERLIVIEVVNEERDPTENGHLDQLFFSPNRRAHQIHYVPACVKLPARLSALAAAAHIVYCTPNMKHCIIQ